MLQEIHDLQREFKENNVKINKKAKQLECVKKGLASRSQACSTFQTESNAAREDFVLFDFPEYDEINFNDENVDTQNLEVQETEMSSQDIITDAVTVDLQPSCGSTSRNPQVLNPIRTRKYRLPAKYGGIHYLKEKHEWEKRIKERELNLEERKLALEERKFRLEEQKFEMEKKERDGRLTLEIQQREQNFEISKQQLNTINFFMKHFNNKSN